MDVLNDIFDTLNLQSALWAQIFFVARLVHAPIYILAIPFLRTPVYLVSWAAILAIGAQALI